MAWEALKGACACSQLAMEINMRQRSSSPRLCLRKEGERVNYNIKKEVNKCE
jgi:hypothetical protein